MAVYRATRTSAFDATQYRIDIVPYDANIGDSVTTLDEGTIVAIGDVEYGFDDVLPYGLAGPMTWDVTLNFSKLPSALQTRLRNKVSGVARNTFLLWTDYGSGGSSWSLLFCGVVDDIESAEYEPNENGEYEATYSCIDAAYFVLLNTAGSVLDDPAFQTDYDGYQLANLIYDYRSTGNMELAYNTNVNGEIFAVYGNTWDSIVAHFNTIISSRIETQAARSSNTDTAKIWTVFDPDSNLAKVINTGARFYAASYGATRSQSTAITSSTAYLATYITGFSGTEAGGLYSGNDEFGFAQAQSFKDIISDLCETFAVKMWFTPEYVTDGGGDYIKWNLKVGTWLGDGAGNITTAGTIDLDADNVTTGTVVEGAGVIGKGETRVSIADNEDKSISEFVASVARSRSERSINVEPIIHNLPTYHDKVIAKSGLLNSDVRFETAGFGQTNVILRNYQTPPAFQLEKVHEDTRIAIRGDAGGGTVDNSYDAYHTEQLQGVSAGNQQVWLTAVQSTSCLPFALGQAFLQAFGNSFQATIDVTYRVATSYAPSLLGRVHNLTGGVATEFSQLQWSKAVITRVIYSPSEGTSTLSYFIPEV